MPKYPRIHIGSGLSKTIWRVPLLGGQHNGKHIVSKHCHLEDLPKHITFNDGSDLLYRECKREVAEYELSFIDDFWKLSDKKLAYVYIQQDGEE